MYQAIEDEKQIRSAQSRLLDSLRELPLIPQPLTVGFQGGNMQVENLRSNGQIWFVHQVYSESAIGKNWNAFGVAGELRLKGSNKIVVEVNVPLGGNTRMIAGAFLKDSGTGNVVLVHSGKIGGGRKGIGKTAFLESYQGSQVEFSYESRPKEKFRAVVVADFGAGEVIKQIAEFVSAVHQFKEGEIESLIAGLSDDELAKRARNAPPKPRATIVTGTTLSRNVYVSAYAKRRAAGKCELCNCSAPFISQGKPYLECHHIKWLANGGNDSIDNTVALCPNCHRKMHMVKSATDIARLQKRLKSRDRQSA